MFKVEPVRSPELHRDVCAELGCEYHEDTFAFLVGEMNEDFSAIVSVFGLCQFTLDPDDAVIKSIAWTAEHANDEAITIMVRAVMSFCYRAEIPSVTADDTAAPEEYIRSVGFIRKDGKWSIDLKKFYASPCRYNSENK